jgi:hypothetical protein
LAGEWSANRVGYTYDESEWPAAQFRFVGRPSSDEVEAYFRDISALVHGERPYACVINGLDMLIPEREFVRRQALWIQQNANDMRRVNRGVAFVLGSAMIRGLVRAVHHIQPAPVPSATFSELAEGIAWAREVATKAPVSRAAK